MVGEAKQISQVEQHVMEELHVQHFYIVLVLLPMVVMEKSQILVLALRQGVCKIPLITVAISVCAIIRWFSFVGEGDYKV